ncbi:Panacea domain-containing protein [Blastococcus sp. PRF04-17]|uniref:Panacea domain-containing protein n=1 Tax=Blastococcus sp. PRF04-17 TaxID=2933797 RepID=UPI001FF285FF|nr:Panacea domain-containing protein [Blastococcus sp. PRF04-17]UOY03630.1 Panacea domain-containing protein [Blastococcus sp. PRF04-17]
MAVSAHDVARALRARLPGIGTLKLQKLLYYCQGHHLAATEEPLFTETVKAWDNGPVVAEFYGAERYGAPAPEPRELSEAQLNTIGYVVSRYGALTSRDLINMTHNERPYKLADLDREPGTSARIEIEWMREYFSSEGAAAEDELDIDPDRLQEMLTKAEERRGQPGQPDSIDRILERIRQLSA